MTSLEPAPLSVRARKSRPFFRPKAKKGSPPRPVHGALCLVDRKLQAPFDENRGHLSGTAYRGSSARHDPLGCLPARRVDVAVIGVTRESKTAALQLAIKSRRHPCVLLVLRLHQVAQGTFTPKLPDMPSTGRAKRARPTAAEDP